ncbi:hypothetical protein SAMN06269250_0902 [Spirosoma fluviale]|uniref:Uncharacterized protein n=1 Tax=Spirosoma fluviale TaxID=1597977 RepID=A0A286F7U3_9BACT|nr:hypothetical protein SAMN06269250_0902 [Spirosoma fluviale]
MDAPGNPKDVFFSLLMNSTKQPNLYGFLTL